MIDPNTGWEVVNVGAPCTDYVRRFKVPGGWLYQVALDQIEVAPRVSEDDRRTVGWTAPVFVREP